MPGFPHDDDIDLSIHPMTGVACAPRCPPQRVGGQRQARRSQCAGHPKAFTLSAPQKFCGPFGPLQAPVTAHQPRAAERSPRPRPFWRASRPLFICLVALFGNERSPWGSGLNQVTALLLVVGAVSALARPTPDCHLRRDDTSDSAQTVQRSYVGT